MGIINIYKPSGFCGAPVRERVQVVFVEYRNVGLIGGLYRTSIHGDYKPTYNWGGTTL